MVCGRGQGTYPPEFRIRNSESGIQEQINLALALVHSNVCSAEFRKFRGISGIPENKDRQETERRSEYTTKVPHIRLINDEWEDNCGIGANLYGLGGAASC